MVENVRKTGNLLSQRLKERLSHHTNVGDIRGRGLFWGIEFVSDKETREPFPIAANVALGIAELGLTKNYGIAIYPGTGTVDGINGDHIIVSPPYNQTEAEIEEIVGILERLVNDFFRTRTTL